MFAAEIFKAKGAAAVSWSRFCWFSKGRRLLFFKANKCIACRRQLQFLKHESEHCQREMLFHTRH